MYRVAAEVSGGASIPKLFYEPSVLINASHVVLPSNASGVSCAVSPLTQAHSQR